jgi:hypothetical protein
MTIIYGVIIFAGIISTLSLCRAAGRADKCIDDMEINGQKKDW